jgi:hypothetical protein
MRVPCEGLKTSPQRSVVLGSHLLLQRRGSLVAVSGWVMVGMFRLLSVKKEKI